MESSNTEVLHEFPFFRVYKDGRVEKFMKPVETIPPSEDPVTGIRSKDAVVSSEPHVSVRIFVPKSADPTHKLPLIFYIHGGAFSIESAFSAQYDAHVRTLVHEANVVAVSVEYGLFPECPIPRCYDDSWAALNWVASHSNGNGPETWLNDYVDFRRVSLVGDSAGGNIAHTLVVRVGSFGLPGVKVVGAILVHPFFGGTDHDSMWLYMCPTNSGLDDPRLKPSLADLERLRCDRVLVFVAEQDHLRDVGISYTKELKRSGWKGTVELVESKEEQHCFHLWKCEHEKAVALRKALVSFINQD